MKVVLTFVALSCLCCFPSLAPTARAQDQKHVTDDERARGHFARGQSYFKQARYDEAAQEFATAYELSGRPEMLINQARALELAQRVDEAIAALTTLLDRFPHSEYRGEATAQLERLYEKRPPTRADSAPAPAPSPPAVQPEPEPAPPDKASEDAAAPRKGWWPPSPLTLVLGSLAVAAGAASLGTGLYAHHLHGELESRCDGGDCGPSDDDDIDRGRRFARTSTGLSFAGLTLAVTAAVLWGLEIKRERARPEVQLSFTRDMGEAQLRWEL